jgi:hypothetical protein
MYLAEAASYWLDMVIRKRFKFGRVDVYDSLPLMVKLFVLLLAVPIY